jgi:hypothetical protein
MIELGIHRLHHGDLIDGIESLMGNDLADVFYSDPPWGNRMLTYFRTIRKRDSGECGNEDKNINVFLDSFFKCAIKYTKPSSPIFVEYGISVVDELLHYASSNRLNHEGTFTIKYKSGSRDFPNHLHIFSKEKLRTDFNYLVNLEKLRRVNLIEYIIRPFAIPNGIVLDPCCGHGLTGEATRKLSMKFYGNEFNRSRLERSIEKFK